MSVLLSEFQAVRQYLLTECLSWAVIIHPLILQSAQNQGLQMQPSKEGKIAFKLLGCCSCTCFSYVLTAL